MEKTEKHASRKATTLN